MLTLGDSIAALRGLKSILLHMTGDERVFPNIPHFVFLWQGGAEFGIILYHVASYLGRNVHRVGGRGLVPVQT